MGEGASFSELPSPPRAGFPAPTSQIPPTDPSHSRPRWQPLLSSPSLPLHPLCILLTQTGHCCPHPSLVPRASSRTGCSGTKSRGAGPTRWRNHVTDSPLPRPLQPGQQTRSHQTANLLVPTHSPEPRLLINIPSMVPPPPQEHRTEVRPLPGRCRPPGWQVAGQSRKYPESKTQHSKRGGLGVAFIQGEARWGQRETGSRKHKDGL